MRFMMIVKASKDSEAGVMPEPALIDAMTKYNEELVKAGVLLDLSGLHPTSRATRITYTHGKVTVTDGPFGNPRDQIAGYWLIKVKSRAEALEWAKRAPAPDGKGQDAEIELRQLFELEDFEPGEAIDRAREVGRELARQQEGAMGAKSEALAREFDGKAQAAAAFLSTLTDAERTKTTQAERWTVGVTAHHLAGAFEAVSGIVTGIVTGKTRDGFTRKMLDELNARHAQEFAGCTRAETVALFDKGAATARSVIRGLSDDQLARTGTVFSDVPPMSAEQLIDLGLIRHIDEHIGSIRRTIGR
jgi:hypothetical protein